METNRPSQEPMRADVAMEKLLEKEILERADYDIEGARVVVDHAYFNIQDNLAPDVDRVVTIYIPGMPHAPEQNFVSDAQEIGMIKEMLTGKATDLIVLKPEGLNKEAFLNGAEAETSATLQQLESMCAQFGLDLSPESRLKIVLIGQSEGANQAASLAMAMQDRYKRIAEFVAIEPVGVVGYDDVSEARLWPKGISKTMFKGLRGTKDQLRKPDSESESPLDEHVLKTDTGYRLSGALIESYSDIFQHGGLRDGEDRTAYDARVAQYKEKASADGKSVVTKFVKRLAGGVVGLDIKRGIKRERLRYIWTKNKSYEALAGLGMPITMVSMEGSIFAPQDEITEWVRNIRSEGNSQVSLLTSTGKHWDPTGVSRGIGAALGFIDFGK